MISEYARIDSPWNTIFLANALFDKNGQPRGECVSKDPSKDTDGDTFPDDCDNCPNIPNDQTDSDDDGIGDRCDNCRFDSNPKIANAPREFDPELPNQLNVNFFAETVARGVPKSPGAIDDDGYLTKSYPGDVCDPNPLTTLQPLDEGYAGSPAITAEQPKLRRIDCTIKPGKHCKPGTSDVHKLCSVSVGNAAEATSFVAHASTKECSPTGDKSPRVGLTRGMYCACPPGNTPDQCRTKFGCSQASLANPLFSWMPMTIDDADAELRLSNNGLVQTTHTALLPTGGTSHRWGWAYWNDLPNLPPPVPSSSAISVFDGLLWTWVRAESFGPTPIPFAAPPTGDITQQTVRQFTAPIHVVEQGESIRFQECPPDNYGLIHRVTAKDCPSCTAGLGIMLIDRSDPVAVGLLTPNGDVRVKPNLIASQLASRLGDGSSRLILASDSIDVATGSGVGALVDDRGVVEGVVADGPQGLHLRAVGGPSGTMALPHLAVPFVAVASAKRQELAIFLPSNDGVELRTYDFDADRTVVKTITPALGALASPRKVSRSDLRALDTTSTSRGARVKEELHSVVAATYRYLDDSYYVLDRSEQKFTLFRIGTDMVSRTIASWSDHNFFATYSMTTAANGSLVFSATNAKVHMIALLDIERGSDALSLESVLFGAGRLALGAVVNESGMSYAVERPDGSSVLVERSVPASRPNGLDPVTSDLERCF